MNRLPFALATACVLTVAACTGSGNQATGRTHDPVDAAARTNTSSTELASALPAGNTTVRVSGGQTRTTDIRLAQAGGITGVVTYRGAPRQGIRVVVFSTDGTRVGNTSEATGRYRVPRLFPGRYRVCAGTGKHYYPDGTIPGALYGLSGHCVADVRVTGGASTPNVDFALEPSAALTGTIRGPSGTLLPADSIAVYRHGTELFGAELGSTRSVGRFLIGVPAGDGYQVCATSHSNAGSAPAGYVGACSGGVSWYGSRAPRGPTLTARAGRTSASTVRLTVGGEIAGTVSAEDGSAPLQESEVLAFRDGKQLGFAITDANGHFRLLRLRPGDYTVCAIGGGDNRDHHAEFGGRCLGAGDYYGGRVHAGARHVTVRTRTEVGADLSLPARTASIGGTVTAAGHPLRSATVQVFDVHGHEWGSAQTNSRGSYDVQHLIAPRGGLVVCVDGTNARSDSGRSTTAYARACTPGVPWSGGALPAGAEPVAVHDATTTHDVDLSVGRGAAIAGRVTDTRASAGATVSVIAPESEGTIDGKQVVIARRDVFASGAFVLPGLTPGTYTVCVEVGQHSVRKGLPNGLSNTCYRNRIWAGRVELF